MASEKFMSTGSMFKIGEAQARSALVISTSAVPEGEMFAEAEYAGVVTDDNLVSVWIEGATEEEADRVLTERETELRTMLAVEDGAEWREARTPDEVAAHTTKIIARWNDAALFCSTCGVIRLEGTVTADNRMRCFAGHDTLSPATAEQIAKTRSDALELEWAENVENLLNDTYCPHCQCAPEKFTLTASFVGRPVIDFECSVCDFHYQRA